MRAEQDKHPHLVLRHERRKVNPQQSASQLRVTTPLVSAEAVESHQLRKEQEEAGAAILHRRLKGEGRAVVSLRGHRLLPSSTVQQKVPH